uniref:NADH dehydrogenase [ubiquinone] 1 alpha subcomplex subunit 5 n=1 Tax=Eptatretus burgeri TaxID=7764 RepID=A0A8C4QPR5_EPTBU
MFIFSTHLYSRFTPSFPGRCRINAVSHHNMAAIKKTTGLVGLAVAENPHERLKILYKKILNVLETIPKEAAYRKFTAQLIGERLQTVDMEPDVEKLEKKINCGQLEEVIQQAESELFLARKMVEWKPWEPLIGTAPANQWKWPV